MNKITKNNQVDINLLKVGIILMFMSLLIFSAYLWLKAPDIKSYPNKNSQLNMEKVVTPDENLSSSDLSEISWEKYANQEFGFEMEIPKFLVKRELRGQGDYELFIRFEENNFSAGKGIALGIRPSDFEKEVERLKEDFKGQDAELVKDEIVLVGGQNSKYFQYSPKLEDEEERGMLIIPKGTLVISVSSVPGQIPRIIDSFKFYR